MGPSCNYVTEENKEAWQRFVEMKIREVMKPETMELKEFKECLKYVQEEKRKQDRLRIRLQGCMKRRPLYVRRKCNQNIMGKDVGFCMVSKRQVATYG